MTGFVSSSDTARTNRARSLIARAVLVGGLIGAALSLINADFEHRTVFDTWQRIAPREISTDNVAVVLVDDASIEAENTAWPWSRFLMARLIEQIGSADPAAIGIDIYFTEDDPLRPEAFASIYTDEELDPATRTAVQSLPLMDEDFAQVLGSTPSVLARFGDDVDGYDPDELFFNSIVEGEPPAAALSRSRVVASIFSLDGSAMSQGMVNGPPDSDGIVRRVPLSVSIGDTVAPGFALELARIGLGEDTLAWEGNTMRIGDVLVPADKSGRLPIKMGHFPPSALYSASDVMRGRFDPQAFAGKVVLVGVGATGTFDIVATPLRAEVGGVLVQAQAVDAIIEKEWLSRPNAMIVAESIAALALFALIFAAGYLVRKWLLWLALVLALAVPIGSWLAYSQANLLFDPVRPLLVALGAVIGLAIMRYSIAREDRSRLEGELVEERIRASEQKGELEAARRIQMSMVPSEKTLSRLDDRVEVGGVLEPAKSVGGDFFDAVKINENLLLFLVGDVTGKGVPAALFMALSKTLSKSNLARAADGLDAAVAALNFDLMDEADDEMGLTMLVGMIDCSTGRMELVNAGHENPMVVRASGEVITLPMIGGPPFCVVDFPYCAETFELSVQDTLVIITDGATEAANECDQLFGVDGVLNALKTGREVEAPRRAQDLAARVREFEGASDPSDDLTIFTLRFLGPLAHGGQKGVTG